MKPHPDLIAICRPILRELCIIATLAVVATIALSNSYAGESTSDPLDNKLITVLRDAGFTGKIESTLEKRLKRPINPRLAALGQLLFFDTVGGLHNDNTCAGCHAPSAGMGDTQSIAIGIQSNGIVGPHRKGPRNQRRTPSVINTAFYPKLMWNGRFFAPGGDPFSNEFGFTFPLPEGITQFPPNDPSIKHLLVAQAHIPPTELVEVAGFGGTKGSIAPRFDQFDDYPLCVSRFDCIVPAPDSSGFRNATIRQAVLERLNSIPQYRRLFSKVFPELRAGLSIDFSMFGRAIAEFEFTLVRADAPVDRFARGQHNAMTDSQKRGALVFFGKGNCIACHSVAGQANEMFSDFQMHNIGVPQIAPAFGAGLGNVIFDGPDENEDFGLEQLSGLPGDRYKFRSSPLRNVSLQPAFFHNGAYTRLDDAIRHHLNPQAATMNYDPKQAGVDPDLAFSVAPPQSVLATLDPILATPIDLDADEFDDLLAFVSEGLLDDRARPESLCRLIPRSVPSGLPLLNFEDCPKQRLSDEVN